MTAVSKEIAVFFINCYTFVSGRGGFMNISALFKIKDHLKVFKDNHPDFVPEAKKVCAKGFCEDQEVSITVKYPDGTEIEMGVKVKETDLPFFNAVKELLTK